MLPCSTYPCITSICCTLLSNSPARARPFYRHPSHAQPTRTLKVKHFANKPTDIYLFQHYESADLMIKETLYPTASFFSIRRICLKTEEAAAVMCQYIWDRGHPTDVRWDRVSLVFKHWTGNCNIVGSNLACVLGKAFYPACFFRGKGYKWYTCRPKPIKQGDFIR